jgi:anti-anti-sigma regulatory factor
MTRKPSLEITRRELPNLDILHLKGPLRFGEPDLIFRTEVGRSISHRKCRLVVDLEDVATIDTFGCGTLLTAEKELRCIGRRDGAGSPPAGSFGSGATGAN